MDNATLRGLGRAMYLIGWLAQAARTSHVFTLDTKGVR